jgi:hypothetical protein
LEELFLGWTSGDKTHTNEADTTHVAETDRQVQPA